MRRVVITGLGAVSPCGLDVASTWEAVVAGRSGIAPVSRFDTTGWSVRIAGEVKGFRAEASIDPKLLKRVDLFTQYGMAAAHEAVIDSGMDPERPMGDRVGVYLGTGIGGLGEIYVGSIGYQKDGPKALSPFFIPKALTNLAGGHVAMRYQARGPSLCISTACATGNHSIGEAWRAIRNGDADAVLAGGTEAAIHPVGMAGFMVMKALSKRNDEPTRASRPFDRDRDGFVMGEGAGVVMLEALEHAQARGARIYAEVLGYGLSNDAHHITAPPPGGEGAVRCIRMALASAGLRPEQVDTVNAHGTSTPANDSHETQAIKTVFGDHSRALTVTSTKSVTGHLLGAAGGLEAVLLAKTLQTGVVPPTANLENPDPECDLDYVPGQARTCHPRVGLSNAFGFGGTNAALLLGAWSP